MGDTAATGIEPPVHSAARNGEIAYTRKKQRMKIESRKAGVYLDHRRKQAHEDNAVVAHPYATRNLLLMSR